MLQHKMLPPKQSKLQVPGADNSSGLDNKPASLLSFEGARHVHGIYNWILDSTLSQAADALDVPAAFEPLSLPGSFHSQVGAAGASYLLQASIDLYIFESFMLKGHLRNN